MQMTTVAQDGHTGGYENSRVITSKCSVSTVHTVLLCCITRKILATILKTKKNYKNNNLRTCFSQ